MASAQVKSAILLAGLSASGTTIVREAVTTRTHTEEMLAEAGADITVEPWGEGRVVTRARVDAAARRPHRARRPVGVGLLRRGRVRGPGQRRRGGRTSTAARPGSATCRCSSAWGPTSPSRPTAPGTATIRAAAGPLRAPRCRASEIPSLDEVPALAVAAAVAEGTTVFSDVGELRVKEVDRLAAVAATWSRPSAPRPGSRATPSPSPASGGPLRGARFDSRGDHRMAMAAAVAGAGCPRRASAA